MPAEISASVIICAYTEKRLDEVRAAIRSAASQTPAPIEIIVVIDHNDALLATLSAEFPAARVIANAHRQGLSGARNTGVHAASGDVVAFLDDDAVAPAGWLAALLAPYADPDVAAVGGGATPVWPAGRPAWLPREFDWVVGCTFEGQPTEIGPVRNLLGCNMSVRRDVVIAAGGFNEGLGRSGNDAAGCEETELCIRIRQMNGAAKIIYDPRIVVRHSISADRTAWRYFRTRCIAEGRSKARLSVEVGSDDGLAAERSHVARVLPLGMARGFAETVTRRDPWGPVRAFNIAAGLGFAAWGYARGKLRRAPVAAPAPFMPVRIVEIDLDAPLPTIDAHNPATGSTAGSAFALVRREGRAVGTVMLPALPITVTPEMLGDLPAATPEAPPANRPIRIDVIRESPTASVVIATRDRTDSLARCLDSVLAQEYRAFDIVVADSAPATADTAEMIATRYAATGRVRYIRAGRPGLGHAHNVGMSLVQSPIATFTDDDVVVDRRWLGAMVDDFTGGPNVGCVTGLILPAELETRAQMWTERHGAFGKGFARIVFDMDENRPASPLFPYTAGQFGSGANMAFLTEALRKIGGFDPALGAGTRARGGDDLLSFYQVVRAGYQLVYEPQAILWHYHRRGEEGMRRQAFGYGMGLGAYLTNVALNDPAAAFRLALALPSGLRHMWGSGSKRMANLPDDYPRDLVWRERLGVLAGTVGYVRSATHVRTWPEAERRPIDRRDASRAGRATAPGTVERRRQPGS